MKLGLTHRFCVLAAFLAIALGGVGCAALNLFRPVEKKIHARVKADLTGRSLAVVPFSFGRMGFYDWEYGIIMAAQVENTLRRELPRTNVTSAGILAPTLGSQGYHEFDRAALALRAEVDYVLVVGFDVFQARDPKSLNYMQGKAHFVMEVLNVRSPGSAAYREEMSVYHPPRRPGHPLGLVNVPEGQVLQALMLRASDLIAKRFYTHTVRNTGPDRGE